ncbi:MAG: GDYXXLXY domain-containing protein [Acidobacteria bacterium]|nr:GDYXXLXY domain-containing protein [Acidobacteriota bacterium]
MVADKVKAAMAAGVFCIGVLAAMLVGHAWPLWTGETVYLRVVPVDPRDLFRGDYVTLRYPINSLQAGRVAAAPTSTIVAFEGHWQAGRPYVAGQTVYVVLEPRRQGGGAGVEHVAVRVSTRKPARGLFLRGRASWSSRNGEPPEFLSVEYGIDAFFVEQGRGKEIEERIRSGTPVFAEVAVSSAGRARLRTLIVDGRRYRQDED